MTRTKLAFNATVVAEVTELHRYDLTLTATSYTPTQTSSSTATSTPTPTPSNTFTPSPTHTPTSTQTASLTPTVTASPTASSTPSSLSETTAIELLASFAGKCDRDPFDSETKYIAVLENGLIDMATGEILFDLPVTEPTDDFYLYGISTSQSDFSPDGTLLVVYGDNVYRLQTGEKLLQGPRLSSPDGQYILGIETRDYQISVRVYDVATQRVVNLPNDFYYSFGEPVALSNEGKLMFDSGTIVELLRPAARSRIAANASILAVSPDGSKVVTPEGVYSLTTGNLLFDFGDYFYPYGSTDSVQFDPSGTYLGVVGVGVFEVESGRRLFGFDEFSFSNEIEFSHDGSLVASSGNVYDTASGSIIHRIGMTSSVLFSNDDSLIALSNYGVFDARSGQVRFDVIGDSYGFSDNGQYFVVNREKSCSVYGLPANSWPVAQRLVVLSETGKIRRVPSISGPIIIQAGLSLEPIAVSEDGQWFQVEFEGETGYVDRYDVQDVLIPDDFPLPEFDPNAIGH